MTHVRLGAVLAPFAVVAFVGEASAQNGAEVHASVSSDTVEVGETFVVELSAMAGDNVRFSDPLLRLPPGLRGQGPSIGSKTLVQMGAAGTMFRRGISAKWRLVASAAGRYTIPAPSLRADGRTLAADAALRVTVVEAGQKPQRKGGPLDPFGMGGLGLPSDDPLGDFFKDAGPKSSNELIIDEPVYDVDALGASARALSLARGDDPYLFLRIVADKAQAVVGEQVTLRFYEYYRVTNERFDEREPNFQDFLRVPLEDEPGQAQRATTAVGARVWFVQELDRVAVFPLRTGALRTGKLHAQFRIPYLKSPSVRRESNDVVIDVREPPLEKRPVGYHVGDVGRFELAATVTPRETIAGETVSVSVRAEGRGVMPNELNVPERTGLEWLTPEKRDQSDVQSGRVGGSRTFGYAVRVLEQGEVELGWVELPYFDPDKREYRIARAALGKVKVTPKAGAEKAPEPTNAPEGDPFATMPKGRLALGEFEPARTHAPALAPLFGWMLGPSFAVVLLGYAGRWIRRARDRMAARSSEPEHLARRALGELKDAVDAASVAAIAERAVHHAIEAATTLKSRGILLENLQRELVARGLSGALAERIEAVLDACAILRFKPGASAADAADLERDAAALVADLLRFETGDAP